MCGVLHSSTEPNNREQPNTVLRPKSLIMKCHTYVDNKGCLQKNLLRPLLNYGRIRYTIIGTRTCITPQSQIKVRKRQRGVIIG